MYIEIYILIQLCIFRKLHYKKLSKEKKVMKISNNGATRREKGQRANTSYKTLHIKLKIDQHESYQKGWGESMCLGWVSNSCSTSGTRRVAPLLEIFITFFSFDNFL
jgi:hypothetical protein